MYFGIASKIPGKVVLATNNGSDWNSLHREEPRLKPHHGALYDFMMLLLKADMTLGIYSEGLC